MANYFVPLRFYTLTRPHTHLDVFVADEAKHVKARSVDHFLVVHDSMHASGARVWYDVMNCRFTLIAYPLTMLVCTYSGVSGTIDSGFHSRSSSSSS